MKLKKSLVYISLFLGMLMCSGAIYNESNFIYDAPTIERIDERLINIQKIFDDKMVNIDNVQFYPKAFLIFTEYTISDFCDVDCALNNFALDLSYYGDTFYGQGLVWMSTPYFYIDSQTISATFFIEVRITQEI